MDKNFESLSYEEVIRLHTAADADLREALLMRADWNELRDKRINRTDLSLEFEKKRRSSYSPGDTAFRHRN